MSIMNRYFTVSVILSLIGLNSTFSQVAKNLNLVWSDEFNGTTLDESKWAHPPAWNRQGGSFWSDENYEMTGDGKLKLTVTERNDSVFCGALRTRNLFDKKYGYFEVRCKVPQMHGGWGAFWLMPYQNKPGNAGNDGTEIDVFESINGWNGQVNHAIHWDGYAAEHQKESYRFSRPDLYDDNYHVFGMMWTPEEYIFYIDNQETWRTSAGGVSDVNQYLKLTLEVSGDTWAGNWDNQVEKPIDWLIDYVRVYDHEPVATEEVDLSFTLLQNNQTFGIGDHVQMHVDVDGPLSGIDEIKFFTQKDGGSDVLKMTRAVTTERTYWYNWFPSKSGAYKLKAKAYKNGVYITNVVVNATVESDAEPLSLSFESLNSGENFRVGEAVDMTVLLSGELTDADELQFLTRNGSEEFVEQQVISINGTSTYSYSWIPQESGVYSLRVTANKNSSYVTHVVVGSITVQEALDPLSLSFNSLNSGSIYQLSDVVNMDVNLSGNLGDATELQFLARNGDGDFVLQHTESITSETLYTYDWQPNEIGNYSLRVTATNNGSYVTHVVVGSVEVKEPLQLSYTDLIAGSSYNFASDIKMDVSLSGDQSEIDELRFIVQKVGESASVLQSTAVIPELALYSYNWLASDTGEFKMKVSAYNNGNYVTHVSLKVNVVEPITLTYRLLEDGEEFSVGEDVKMHVDVNGDMSQADQIKFIVQKIGENGVIDKTSSLQEGKYTYWNKWVPSEAGEYSLKVKAFKGGVFITKVISKITVVETFDSLKTGSNSLDLISFSVYPNPTSGVLYISSETEVSYELYDVSGKLLTKGNGYQVDLSNHAAGVYFISVDGKMMRVMKQ